MTRGWMAGAALIATLGGPGMTAAEPVERPIAATAARLLEAEAAGTTDWLATEGPGRAWVASETAPMGSVARQPAPSDPGRLNRPRKSRVLRGVLGGAVGAVAGAFAGGFLGAAIDGDCGGCDDPGFKGFLIGFPVGGVLGGVLGAKYLFR
jgi:hypothetical protein